MSQHSYGGKNNIKCPIFTVAKESEINRMNQKF